MPLSREDIFKYNTMAQMMDSQPRLDYYHYIYKPTLYTPMGFSSNAMNYKRSSWLPELPYEPTPYSYLQSIAERNADIGSFSNFGQLSKRSSRPFDIDFGGISKRSSRPFDIDFGGITKKSSRPFDIDFGGITKKSSRPFDIDFGGISKRASSRPFDFDSLSSLFGNKFTGLADEKRSWPDAEYIGDNYLNGGYFGFWEQ